jgi:hypothetical protein
VEGEREEWMLVGRIRREGGMVGSDGRQGGRDGRGKGEARREELREI